MITSSTEISSKQDALEAWDQKTVIVRDDEDYVYVYPCLGRGVSYLGFDLRRECTLMGFLRVDQAVYWAQSRGYKPVVLKGVV